MHQSKCMLLLRGAYNAKFQYNYHGEIFMDFHSTLFDSNENERIKTCFKEETPIKWEGSLVFKFLKNCNKTESSLEFRFNYVCFIQGEKWLS